MRKNLVLVVLGILLMGSLTLAAEPKLSKGFEFSNELYRIAVWRAGHFTIWSGENSAGMLWPWPFLIEGNKGDAMEKIDGSLEKKEEGTVIKVEGSTTGYLFQQEIICSANQIKVTFFLEAKKGLEKCYPTFTIHRMHVADKEYEWGPELGVPEETGTISAQKPKVDSSPKYFKFLDLDGRDVTLSFPEAEEVEVRAQQWHRPKVAWIEFVVYPKGMKKGQSIEAGTKGKAQIVFSFAPKT